MLSDIKGREIPIGSTVQLRLVVTNEIAAADPINLLARLEHPWPGVPADLRYSLASQFIELISTPPAAAPNGGAAAKAPAPAPAAPQPAPAAPAAQPTHYRR